MKKIILFAGIFTVLFSTTACHFDKKIGQISGTLKLADGTTINCPGGVFTFSENNGRLACYLNSDTNLHSTIDIPLTKIAEWTNKIK